MGSLEEDLKEVNEKLEALMRRLDYLEAVLTESREYPELAGIMRNLKVGTALYGEPLKMIQRLITVRRILQRSEEHRDDVSRAILNALAIKGPMNISALTREVREARGRASRVTVRKRIRELLDEDLVEKGDGYDYRLVE
ncbi:MAG: hypothetical protein ACLFVP_04755 [Candidatus Bathyarchaeia archaeon]